MTTIPALLATFLSGGYLTTLLNQYFARRREMTTLSYEHLREACNFITKFYARWDDLEEIRSSGYRGDAEEYLDPGPLFDLLIQIRIFGTPKAATLAETAIYALAGNTEGLPVGDRVYDLLGQIRRDLRIKGRLKKRKESKPPPPGPPPPPMVLPNPDPYTK